MYCFGVRERPPPRSAASDFYASANDDGCFYSSRILQAVGDLVNLFVIKHQQQIKCNTIELLAKVPERTVVTSAARCSGRFFFDPSSFYGPPNSETLFPPRHGSTSSGVPADSKLISCERLCRSAIDHRRHTTNTGQCAIGTGGQFRVRSE